MMRRLGFVTTPRVRPSRSASAERSATLGEGLVKRLRSQVSNSKFQIAVRGLGLMAGVELCLANGSPATAEVLQIIKALLQRGFIVLPEGEHGNVISFTPPLTITESQLRAAVKALRELIGARPARSRGPAAP